MNKNGFVPKGGMDVIISVTLIALSVERLLDSEPVARLFGYGLYALAVGVIIKFYWHEVDVLYEKEDRKKKKIISALSGLSALFLAPLMVALMTWQFFSLYKREIQQAHGNEIRQRNKSHIVQYYIMSVAVLAIGSGLVIYSNFKT